MAVSKTTEHAQRPPKEPAAAKLVRRSLRWLALVCISLAAMLTVALSALWWWAGTDGSLASSISWAQRYASVLFAPLSVNHASGSLRSGGHIDNLVWQQGGLRIEAQEIDLAWRAWSLLGGTGGTLKVERLAAARVLVDDQRPPDATAAAPPDKLKLPLRIALDAFSVAQLNWTGRAAFSASGISGRYAFNGQEHVLDLADLQVASGSYRGHAVLSASQPLMLDAHLSGDVSARMPKSDTPLALAFEATARGPLPDLALEAQLQTASKTQNQQAAPQAHLTARLLAWAAQPVAQADARLQDIDLAALWPTAPQTRLTGKASVQAQKMAAGQDSQRKQAWLVQLDMANRLPGAWDQNMLPIARLEALLQWQGGSSMLKSLKAKLGGGELLASGEWSTPPGDAAASAARPWKLQASLQNVNLAALDTRLAALPLYGQASVRGRGATLEFEASAQTKGSSSLAKPTGQRSAVHPLHLRDASAAGSWNATQAGGTLLLSALRVRSDDAELSGQLQAQPAARSGTANLRLAAPGLNASLQGELAEKHGKGSLNTRVSDAAQAMGWLQKIPGLRGIPLGMASGRADFAVNWQGGWLDPALQAQLDIPLLDWSPSPGPVDAARPGVLKFRAVQASLAGRLKQATFSTQGSLEAGERRYTLQLGADAGLVAGIWQGLLKQFSVNMQDPALGPGNWRLTTRAPMALKWTPAGASKRNSSAGGQFESAAGQAWLTAPTSDSTATISLQALRWRGGELTSAGNITGLPMAWLELLAGPQFAALGVSGNLLFDGAWDARLADSLSLKASLTRSSGDIMVQPESGSSTRVAAGVRQASVALSATGEAVTLALLWDSERAGHVEGQLKTRLSRMAGETGSGGWQWAAQAPLSGQLHAQLPRLGVWFALAPPGWRLRGSLAADLAISGTRSTPQVTGELQANDLALRSVVDGIELGQGRLRASLDGTRMLIKEFSLHGADGTITASGEAAWQNGRARVALNAKLDHLRASVRSDRQITLSGELQARLEGKTTQFSGALSVDSARIVLPEADAPQLGSDVLLRQAGSAAMGKQAPALTSTQRNTPSVKLGVQLDLGQDFRIQGKGLNTLVRGTLSLSGDALTEPRLLGTVTTFGGQYRAYGQRLDVEQGVLRFTGAIDNPALDILAIRPNLTQRVGVQITGTAQLPTVRLYAMPDLPDAEKLSWLVLGRSSASGGAEAALLQQAAIALLGSQRGFSGGLATSLGLDELSFRSASSKADGTTTEGAVTLGKRFSRNFYAAYERSISGALGTLYVFYDLSQRFTVRAQAGQQSAVDLIFTLPYD